MRADEHALCFQYGKEFDFEAPVKLLDRMMHSLPTSREQQVLSATALLCKSPGYIQPALGLLSWLWRLPAAVHPIPFGKSAV